MTLMEAQTVSTIELQNKCLKTTSGSSASMATLEAKHTAAEVAEALPDFALQDNAAAEDSSAGNTTAEVAETLQDFNLNDNCQMCQTTAADNTAAEDAAAGNTTVEAAETLQDLQVVLDAFRTEHALTQ